MQVEVSDWARERIEALVASGRVGCAREAVDSALAALEASDRAVDELLADWSPAEIAELQQSLDEAFADLDAGNGIPMTRELIEDIKREGRRQIAAVTEHPR